MSQPFCTGLWFRAGLFLFLILIFVLVRHYFEAIFLFFLIAIVWSFRVDKFFREQV